LAVLALLACGVSGAVQKESQSCPAIVGGRWRRRFTSKRKQQASGSQPGDKYAHHREYQRTISAWRDLNTAHLPVQEFAVAAIHVVLDPASRRVKLVTSPRDSGSEYRKKFRATADGNTAEINNRSRRQHR
jgi:hypothetical protein